MKKTCLLFALGLSFLWATNQRALAQDVLPKPVPPFNGKIGLTYKDSTPGKVTLRTAPAGAPNVLIFLIDDGERLGDWQDIDLGRRRVGLLRQQAFQVDGFQGGQALKRQALKELPQPQVLFTLGLLNLNPDPSMVST